MNADFVQILLNELGKHWVSAFFLLLTTSVILVILGVRWRLRRRWKRLLEERFNEENELDTLPPMGPEDLEALEMIKQFRQEVWDIPEAELQLNMEALSQRATRIIRSIASVYHPNVEIPQYEASLLEVLQMVRRVSSKLHRFANILPFKFLGARKLSDYQRYYQVYRKINENPVLQILKRNPHLYKAARLAMNIKNLSNPLYWASKELSREGYFYALRWFYLTFVSQVGREAMRLFNGRHFQTEEDRDATLACYRLFTFARSWGGPSGEEWAILVDFIAAHSALESEVKLHILSRCSQNRLPKDLDKQEFQTKSGRKWYQEGLKRLQAQEKDKSAFKFQVVEKELSRLDKIEE